MKYRLKRLMSFIIAFAVIFTSVSCGKNKNGEKKLTAEEEARKLAFELYENILNNPENEKTEIDEELWKSGNFKYSLVDLGDKAKALLLSSQQKGNGVQYIKMFKLDEKNKKIITSKETFPIGVAEIGGFRGGITKAKGEKALIYTTVQSGTGDLSIYKLDVKGDKLEETTLFEGSIVDETPKISGEPIEFVDVNDRELLKKELQIDEIKGVDKDEKKEKSDNPKKEKSNIDEIIKAEEENGNTVIFGEIREMSRQELLDFQNMPEPNGITNDETVYTVLIPENKPIMEGKVSGAANEVSAREVSIIRLWDFNGSKYNGKKVFVSIEPGWYWPSDTSLPLGEPTISNFKILE